jgi:hypothetical protein
VSTDPEWLVDVEHDLEVIHRSTATAQCDVAHTIDDVKVDRATVDGLIERAEVRALLLGAATIEHPR